MKIDDHRNALAVAHKLVDASVEQIAKALTEAHLEGMEQGRSLLLQGRSVEEVLDELGERRRFLRAQIEKKCRSFER